MRNLFNLTLLSMLLLSLSSCGFTEHIENRARVINSLEDRVLLVTKENQALRAEVIKLKYQVNSLESKSFYLQTQLQSKKEEKARKIASIKKKNPNDLVKFDVYRWKPDEMIKIAEKEFDAKNYEKSAQFFSSFMENFPASESLDDKFLFQAGVASFETGKHYEWSESYFSKLIEKYPTSDFYLSTKMWLALSYLKQGKNQQFFSMVEEFRKKYRNTSEWNILSSHYEKIVQKYKSN